MYSQETQVRVARMYLEDGLPVGVITQETGISDIATYK